MDFDMDCCELYKGESDSRTHQKVGGFGTAVDQRITSGMSNVVDLQNEGSYLRVAQVSIHRLNAEASTYAGF